MSPTPAARVRRVLEVAPANARRLGTAGDVLAALVLVALYLVIQTLFLREPTFYDPVDYMAGADSLGQGGGDHRMLRIGLVIPVAIAQQFFGYSEAAYYTVPYLAGAGLVVGTYALGRMLFGRLVAVLATLMLVVNPYLLAWSSQLYPSLPATTVFVGAIAILIHVGRARAREEVRARREVFLVLLSGGLLGWSYLIREYSILMFPIVLIIFWMYPIPRRYLVHLLAMGLAALGLELVWGWAVEGNPVARAEEILTRTAPNPNYDIVLEERAEARGGFMLRMLTFGRLLLRQRVGYLYLGLGTSLLVAWLLTRSRAFTLLGVWAIGMGMAITLMGAVTFGGGRTILYSLLLRYWFPVFPPLIVGGIAGLGVLAERAARLVRAAWVPVTATTVTTVAIVALSLVEASRLWDWDAPTHFDQFRTWLAEHGDEWDTLWVEESYGNALRMYTNSTFGSPVWEGEVGNLNRRRRFVPRTVVDEGLVAYAPELFQPAGSFLRGSTPSYLLDQPDTWRILTVTAAGPVVVFEATGQPVPSTRLLTVGRGGHLAWQTLPQRGPSYPQPVQLGDADPVRVSLTEDDQIVVIDNAAPYLEPPQGGPVVVDDDAVVRVEVSIAADGGGDVNFHCFFYEPDGDRTLVHGITAWRAPLEEQVVEYQCPVPAELERPLRVRFGFQVVGPLEVDTGPLTARVEPMIHGIAGRAQDLVFVD